MMCNKILSIIVPAYNVENYIIDCLKSISQIRSDYIEIIVIDDCSVDNTCQIIEGYLKYDHRIKYIKNDVNKGLSQTRNVGILNSLGSFIAFVDSDDIIISNSYDNIIKAIKQTDINLIKICRNISTSPLESLEKSKSQKIEINFSRRNISSNQIRNIDISAVTSIVRRSFLIENELFFYPGILHEDYLWSFNLLKNIRIYLSYAGISYIQRDNRPGSIMNTLNVKRIQDLVFMFDKSHQWNNMDNKFHVEMTERLANAISSTIFKHILKLPKHTFSILSKPVLLFLLKQNIRLKHRIFLFVVFFVTMVKNVYTVKLAPARQSITPKADDGS